MQAVHLLQPAGPTLMWKQPPWHLHHQSCRPAAAFAAKRVTSAAAAATRAASVSAAPLDERPMNFLLVLAFLGLAVSNRVFNRILLAPLRQHTFFLAQATGVAQLLAFAALLARRTRRGFATAEMWEFVKVNKRIIAAIGVAECMFYPAVFCSAARLPGALVQVLNQSVVPFTVAFGVALLGRRYRRRQFLGVAVVLAAVVLAATPPNAPGLSLSAVRGGFALKDVALCVTAYGLLAFGVTCKDMMFTRWRTSKHVERQAGTAAQHLDVTVVCTPAAVVQLTGLMLTWPVLVALGAPGVGGWSSALEGARVLSGVDGGLVVPMLAIAYWGCNVAFSVCTLEFVRRASAATVFLANVAALPLSAFIFCLPLPFLERQAFHLNLIASLALAVDGNLMYGSVAFTRKSRK